MEALRRLKYDLLRYNLSTIYSQRNSIERDDGVSRVYFSCYHERSGDILMAMRRPAKRLRLVSSSWNARFRFRFRSATTLSVKTRNFYLASPERASSIDKDIGTRLLASRFGDWCSSIEWARVFRVTDKWSAMQSLPKYHRSIISMPTRLRSGSTQKHTIWQWPMSRLWFIQHERAPWLIIW